VTVDPENPGEPPDDRLTRIHGFQFMDQPSQAKIEHVSVCM